MLNLTVDERHVFCYNVLFEGIKLLQGPETAFCLGRYSLHLLLLKSSTVVQITVRAFSNFFSFRSSLRPTFRSTNQKTLTRSSNEACERAGTRKTEKFNIFVIRVLSFVQFYSLSTDRLIFHFFTVSRFFHHKPDHSNVINKVY